MSFADLGVSRPVTDALKRRGIVAPFAVQKLVIADVLAGRDVLVQSPTGSGKTLAFGVPLADRLEPGGRRPSALVLAPTRELRPDRRGAPRRRRGEGAQVAPVHGGVGIEKQAKRAARADIVVATPGRLEDLLQRRRTEPRARADPGHRRGRPDARHGLQARGRPNRRPHAARSPDAVLLGDARGRGRKAGARLHARCPSPRSRARARGRRGGLPPLRAPRAPGEGGRPRQPDSRSRGWANAGLRTHQAWRRPACQAARQAPRARRRDARQQISGTAPEGARPLRRRPRWTPSSRPTSRRGAWTWTT